MTCSRRADGCRTPASGAPSELIQKRPLPPRTRSAERVGKPEIPICAEGLVTPVLITAIGWLAVGDTKLRHEGVAHLLDLIAEGDRVAGRVTYRATHRGPFVGVPATGRRVEFEAFHIVRFARGRAVEWWGTADIFGALIQVGAEVVRPT